ncbi:homoserine dehydrogenase [Candidatus Caldatribacterium saccharofermentans]|uniref:homoserine dehydrogenase n=1 Tax=Candidatus Caldatribacterium saccharofermentans TaxID=1454753 RepID=UPI003D072DB7
MKIGVIGFGTVGAGTVKVLWERQSDIEKVLGVRIQVARVIDKDWVRERPVVVPPELRGEDPALVLEDPEIQIVVEAIGGVSPAFEIVSEALSRGKSVVTPNKELIAKRGGELLEIATKQGVDLFFEGAVGGGIPIIHALKEQLAGDDIEEVIGIVNGTTNFILSAMSLQRAPYEEALREAQRRGFAEPIPTMDVEGFDAAYKLAILASLCFHTKVDVDSVFREGITRLIPEDLEFARELGFVVKLLAISKKTNGRLELRVHPVLLPEEHPLASVTGVENAIYVKSKTRALTFRGPGAGGEATGSALVGDIIEAIRNLKYNCRGRVGCTCLRELSVRPVEELVTQYCVRILALDVPGVLGKIATQFGEAGVSLSAVKQPVSTPGKLTNIYFLTHEVQEARLRDSLERIQRLEVVKDVYAIRVERGDS